MHIIPPQLVGSEFRWRAVFSSPLFPAPELSSSDDLFSLFLNLRNASVHFGWSSATLRHLQWRQLHLNLLFRLCVVGGEAQAFLQHHLPPHEAGLKQLREQSASQAFCGHSPEVCWVVNIPEVNRMQFPVSMLPSCDRQACTKLIPSLSFLQTSIPSTTSRPTILDFGPLAFSYLPIGRSQ